MKTKNKNFIKIFNLLFVSLWFFAASCSKKRESIPAAAKTTEWKIYKDPLYPIVFEYPLISVRDDTYGSSRVSAFPPRPNEDYYDIHVFVNLSEEFPDYSGANEPFSLHPLMNESLAQIIFFKELNFSFVRHLYAHINEKIKIEEATLNSIPVLRFVYSDTNYVELYVPLIPDYYLTINDGIPDSDEGHPTSYRRIKALTERVLKSIRWERPINANTHEFKEWKAHILWLIEKASAMPKKSKEAYVDSVLEEAKKRRP